MVFGRYSSRDDGDFHGLLDVNVNDMGNSLFLGWNLHIVLVNAGEITVRVSGTEESLTLELDVF